ncbi:PLP-dependent transferase [Dothidotthia symphoricarpi CBS 119687]|uniref:PLP-dependent transferase n=1 Tax=Dothidotthia symphoricarpi CBS 119687 TaxID=1392245 RepID=A0A6A6A6T9_9PLEO|nr:PLP-dependent transferase [Dothidotthia symphoricarpi CBS 119687]KAF2127609.1 PLP-dependent transferase [Dothidotthia symphoricarpi CBS 119687]
MATPTNNDTSSNVLALRTKSGVKFGKELREKDFLFGEGYLNLNHGSFGTYPLPVREAMRSYQDQAEARPDHFIRYAYPTLLDESREAISKILNAPSETLVFLPNATTGVNTVLRNLVFSPGEHILYFATIYGACEKTVDYITETTPAKSVKIAYTYPVEDDWLVEAFRQKVAEVERQGGKVKVAVFDTVVSMPGVRVPFEALTAACREAGVLSCIDGAHGVGHVELDLPTLDPDFFVSNCHKWLHVPRGCAIFYVPVRNQHLIRSTLPTSHGFMPKNAKIGSPFPKSAFVEAKKSAYVSNFEFVGTIDNAPFLCLPTALKWREELGGEEKIREYCFTLAKQAAQHVAEVLRTEMLDNKTETLSQCCLTNVRLPISVAKAKEAAAKAGLESDEVGSLVRDWVSKTLISDYNTFVQTLFYNGAWWTRLSAQVYLEMGDFEWAAQTLKNICERVDSGEWAVVESKL